MGPRAILFDMDGVLIHSKEVWFRLMNGASRDLGYPGLSRPAFESGWGQGVQADVELIFTRHSADEIAAYYDAHFMDHRDAILVDEDAGTVVDAIRKKGIEVAVVTNTPTALATAILEFADLVFPVVVGFCDGLNGKPAPDMVLHACERLAVAPADALFIGDSSYDREAARAAGVTFVGLGIDGDRRISSLVDLI